MNDKEYTIRNLRLVADHIEANVSQEQINMESYHTGRRSDCLMAEPSKCATSACVVGHATSVESLELNLLEVQVNSPINWLGYARRIFPYKFGKVWQECLSGNLSSDKSEVFKRLHKCADTLEAH